MLGGQIISLKITTRHSNTADDQFARYTLRYWGEIPIENINFGIRDWRPD